MKALCWHGREDIRCETVPDPKILDDRDAIIKVTSCAICGSDLHLNCNIQHGDRWQRPYAQTVQTHVQKYPAPLMKLIEDGKIDPSFLITHRINIEDGPETYRTFRDKKDGCIKVVIKPNG